MKERLTGAIIVVALLVLLVPELLTGPESRQPAVPAGTNGAPLRSYTIDLQGDASGQPPPPTVPAAAASEDPVGEATPEPDEGGSPPVADVSPPVDDATRAEGRPMGSGADASAATTERQASSPGSSRPSAEDERPHSAFGPNARPQPESAGSPTASGSAEPSVAKAGDARADAARPAAAKAEEAKADAARAAAAKAEAAKAAAARAAAAQREAARTGGSKGWAVQLGVFGNRDNADRLAKQVKGSGFPVLFNETTGKDGKKLYWVRVGPEPDEAAAVALSARLKAAGHRDTRVVEYP